MVTETLRNRRKAYYDLTGQMPEYIPVSLGEMSWMSRNLHLSTFDGIPLKVLGLICRTKDESRKNWEMVLSKIRES